VESNQDELRRRAPLDLHAPHRIRAGWRAWEVELGDIDPEEVTDRILSVAGLAGLIVVLMVAAAVGFALKALLHQ
jgi:hypothetical protein